jgi:opacity protein-like surface antigen
MKKVLLVSAMALVAGFSYAQTITPKVGISLSTVSDGDESNVDTKSKIGFTLGAAFNFPITESFSIQPELSYVQKGTKSKESYTDGPNPTDIYESENKITINYLEIPVLAKYSFGEGTKFFLNAGPSLGFGLGGKTKREITQSYGGQSASGEIEGDVKFGDLDEDAEEGDVYLDNRIDFGVQLGAGVLIANKIQIDVRYGLGLSALYDDAEDGAYKNRVIQFTVGIPFSLGGK